MFSRPFLKVAPQIPRRRRPPRWMRWMDGAFSAALVGGLSFVYGGPYTAIRDWQASHAIVDVEPSGDLTPPDLHLTPYDHEQIKCLATNMWQEAANQGASGMKAVAAVTLNRLFAGKYGKDICGVVTAHWRVMQQGIGGQVASYRTHWEFSWLGQPHRDPSGPTWRTARELAAQVYIAGDHVRDDTRGARYYLNPALTSVRRNPAAISAIIGDHTFYTD